MTRPETGKVEHMLYKAFISYSHAADGRLAPAVQSALHRFARPWYRLRALRVFRDKTSLAVSPALWPAIERALVQAEYFILFASPGAARSPWVEREIEHWLAHRSVATLLVVLTEGELVWDAASGDFDWTRTTALPARFAGAFHEEPLHLDLRWAQEQEQLSLRNPRFRDAIAQLASTLHGRPLDELIGEDVRQHRRTRRLAWGAVGALTLLTVTSVVAALVAIQRTRLANERLRIMDSRRLAVEALGAERPMDQALLLAVEAISRSPTAEAAATLKTLLDRASRLEVILHRPAEGFAFSPDGKTLALGLEDGSIERLETGTFRPLGAPLRGGDHPLDLPEPKLSQAAGWPMSDVVGVATRLVFTPGGKGLLAVGPDAYNPPFYTLYQWDLETDPARALRIDRTHLVAVSPEGQTAAMLERWADLSRVRFWNSVEHRDAGPLGEQPDASPIWSSFSPAGDRLIVGYHDGGTQLWSGLDRAPHRATLDLDARQITSAVFRSAGDEVFLGTESGAILRWRLDQKPEKAPPLQGQTGRIVGLAVTPGGVLTSVGEGGAITNWYLDRPEPVSSDVGRLDPPIAAAFFSRDASKLAALQRSAARQPHAVDLWLRPEPRGSFQAAAVFSSVFEGRVTAERLPAPAAPPGVATTSEFLSLTDRGSLGWSFDAPPLGFDPRGERMVTRSTDGGLAVWSLGERRSLGWQHAEALTGLGAAALSPDGRRLAWASDKVVELWDLETEQHLEPVATSSGDAVAVAFSPDGRSLALAELDQPAFEGRIRIVDATTGEPVGPVLRLSDEPGQEGSGRGWVRALAFTSDGRRLISRSYSSELVVWDLDRGTPHPLADDFAELPLGTQDLPVHPSRPLLGFGVDTSIALLDLGAENPHLEPVIEAPAMVASLAFDPDGETLAAGLSDGSVHFWSLTSRQPVGEPLTGGAGSSLLTGLSYDATGRYLATVYAGKAGAVVRLWDLEARAPVVPDFTAAHGWWHQVLLTPDAQRLVWASEGSGPIVWNARLEGWLARACRLANRDFDPDEWQRFIPFDPYRQTCAGRVLTW